MHVVISYIDDYECEGLHEFWGAFSSAEKALNHANSTSEDEVFVIHESRVGERVCADYVGSVPAADAVDEPYTDEVFVLVRYDDCYEGQPCPCYCGTFSTEEAALAQRDAMSTNPNHCFNLFRCRVDEGVSYSSEHCLLEARETARIQEEKRIIQEAEKLREEAEQLREEQRGADLWLQAHSVAFNLFNGTLFREGERPSNSDLESIIAVIEDALTCLHRSDDQFFSSKLPAIRRRVTKHFERCRALLTMEVCDIMRATFKSASLRV
jgi:hypothetical protein